MESRCPFLNAPPSLLNPVIATKSNERGKLSPYYVDPASMTPLQKHCAFFDRNGDGLIVPWETFSGFRALGYNLFLSLLGTVLAHLFFSYWTLDSWIPDPFLAIILRNVDRLKHGSDSEVYERDGTIRPSIQDATVNSLTKYDAERKGGLSLTDILFMTQRKWDVMDLFGWWATKLEWLFLWILCQRNGTVEWRDIMEQYDGTLFHRIEREQKESALAKQD